MTLSEVLAGIPHSTSLPTGEVVGITSDSNSVSKGWIFFAVRGQSRDGHEFVDEALKRGAIAVIGESESSAPGYLRVADSRLALARASANFYRHPSHSMKLIGVTGTSGKTTTTYLIESILQRAGMKVGVIGTVNFRYGGKVLPSTHTTPGATELQKLLAEMRGGGCEAVVMEVSSHALKQHRVACLAFDVAVFTNLSPEHLDFHVDMEDYFQSKSILFRESAEYSVKEGGKRPIAVVNGDDSYGQRLLSELKRAADLKIVSYGMHPPCDLDGSGLALGIDGVRGKLNGTTIVSPLIGGFNGSNILGAYGAAIALGISPEVASEGIFRLKQVPGRLETVQNTRGVHVLVDYAHKPDALEKVLAALAGMRSGHRLVTVFGCGGDRDRKKRPRMGQIAQTYSDSVFVTSDNPRTENPLSIIEEILTGMDPGKPFSVEPDRKLAIRAALAQAQAGDIVLIAGKGHEDYQIIGTQKTYFDDREVAREALQSADIA